LNALEAGKRVARDLCGTEPERMAPPGFADYCVNAFKGSNVKVSVVSDDAHIKHEYPLLHAVARASIEVKRHRPRIIRMVYEPAGEVTKTLLFAGKGITFDTGGADLKVNGHMAGMSRDKGGAAGVAGFMKTVSLLAPAGIKVIAEIGAVRNSIGAEAFVPDEIITSHAGVRVRVGNTDAEGRMLLADLLSHLREDAVNAVNPELFSVATLTGHAALAFGPYTALVENKPARDKGVAKSLFVQGELCADPVEPSLSRREDFDFIKSRTRADDVLSSNNAASVATMRGHQFPMAFLTIASGLDKHEANADLPLAYTHVDIAGSGVENLDWQHGKPTAAPVNVFANTYL
jgi:leucyl aminopeptidase